MLICWYFRSYCSRLKVSQQAREFLQKSAFSRDKFFKDRNHLSFVEIEEREMLAREFE